VKPAHVVSQVAGRGRRYRVEIRKTEKTGWGVFAGEDIPSGSFLGVYAGELLLDAEAEARGQRQNVYEKPEELARAKRRVEERRLKANKGNAKKVDVPCRCGSRKCIGSIWNWESSDDEDE
ncbi:5333_t:CDS:2, partial [Acaulospora colombiana]